MTRAPGRYAPVAPVAIGTSSVRAPGRPTSEVVSVVVGTNSDLLRHVCSLWLGPDDIVADVTYGVGAFWRWSDTLPHYRFDLASGVDMRDLPLADASVDVVVLDPPYRPTHGSLLTERPGGEMFDRYGLGSRALDSINDVLALYASALIEAARVLRPRGRVFVKCQDMSYQSRLHLVSLDVLARMSSAGLALVDQFVLANRVRIGRKTRRRQRCARRAHSLLWVGAKCSGAP